MKLLMISGDRSLLEGRRGAFYYTLEAFSKEWDRIDIITPYVKDAPEALTLFGNVYLHPSPKGLFGQAFWIKRKGMQLHAHVRHDVMTVHDYPPFYNGIGGRMLARKIKIPWVLEIHHVVGYPSPASFTERIGRMLSRVYLPSAIRAASAVRTVSKGTAQLLLSWKAPKSKIFVVPSFYLDRELFESLPESNPLYDVAFCARLVANKGLQNVLKAVAKMPGIRLLVIGDGPDREASEKLARDLRIAQRVEFRGWMPTQEDVLRKIRTAKVFVMNSLSEGGPRSALEAMAAGMPVVVTQVGVMPDVIDEGKNGYFTTGEPDDLVEKISMLLRDPALRDAIGHNARMIVDRFERRQLIAQYARFLKTTAVS